MIVLDGDLLINYDISELWDQFELFNANQVTLFRTVRLNAALSFKHTVLSTLEVTVLITYYRCARNICSEFRKYFKRPTLVYQDI